MANSTTSPTTSAAAAAEARPAPATAQEPMKLTTATATAAASVNPAHQHHHRHDQIAPLASLDGSIMEPLTSTFYKPQQPSKFRNNPPATQSDCSNNKSGVHRGDSSAATDTPTLSGYFDCDELSDMIDDSLFEITNVGCLSKTIFGQRTSGPLHRAPLDATTATVIQSNSTYHCTDNDKLQAVDLPNCANSLVAAESWPPRPPTSGVVSDESNEAVVVSSSEGGAVMPPSSRSVLIGLMSQFKPYDYSSSSRIPSTIKNFNDSAASNTPPSASTNNRRGNGRSVRLSSSSSSASIGAGSIPGGPGAGGGGGGTNQVLQLSSNTTPFGRAQATASSGHHHHHHSSSRASNTTARRKTRSTPNVSDGAGGASQTNQVAYQRERRQMVGNRLKPYKRSSSSSASSSTSNSAVGAASTATATASATTSPKMCASCQAKASKRSKRSRFAFSLFNLFTGGGGGGHSDTASASFDKEQFCRHCTQAATMGQSTLNGRANRGELPPRKQPPDSHTQRPANRRLRTKDYGDGDSELLVGKTEVAQTGKKRTSSGNNGSGHNKQESKNGGRINLKSRDSIKITNQRKLRNSSSSSNQQAGAMRHSSSSSNVGQQDTEHLIHFSAANRDSPRTGGYRGHQEDSIVGPVVNNVRQNKSVTFTSPDRVLILSADGRKYASTGGGSAGVCSSALPPANLQPSAPIIKRLVPKSSSYSQTESNKGLDELLAKYDNNKDLVQAINQKLRLTETIESNLSALDHPQQSEQQHQQQLHQNIDDVFMTASEVPLQTACYENYAHSGGTQVAALPVQSVAQQHASGYQFPLVIPIEQESDPLEVRQHLESEPAEEDASKCSCNSGPKQPLIGTPMVSNSCVQIISVGSAQNNDGTSLDCD